MKFSAGGVGFALAAVVSSGLLTSLMVLFLPLLLIGQRVLFHTIVARIGEQWFNLMSWMLELRGVQIYLSGDDVRPGDKPFIISNHRTRIDWLILWEWMAKTSNLLQRIKIIMKDDIMYLPVLGWGTQFLMFCFIRRNWAVDEKYLSKMMKYYKQYIPESSLLIFPEGTDLAPINVQKSHQFSKERGLPLYHNVLIPKFAGFNHCFTEHAGAYNVLYNITMGYVDYAKGERPNEAALLTGRLPREVHIKLERVELNSIPKDEDGRKQWLMDQFIAKEKSLEAFATNNKFEGGKRAAPDQRIKSATAIAANVLLFYFFIIKLGWLGSAFVLGTCLWLSIAPHFKCGTQHLWLKVLGND